MVLIATVALASFVLSSLAGVWRIYEERSTMEAALLRDGENMLSLLSGSLSHMAMAYDYSNLEEISAKIVENPAIARVAILSAKGKPMASASGANASTNVRSLRRPLLFDGKPVGEIELDLDLDQPDAQFHASVMAILREQLLVTLLLAIALNFILTVLIARPILTLRQHMLDSVERRESENLPEPMPERGLSEFCDIASVFNKLTRSVHSYQARLREKIDVANRELHLANEHLLDRAKELEQKTTDLQQALALVEKLATTDVLTGSFNRRAFEQFFDLEISKHVRYKREATLVLFDLDFFKAVNDNYGHAAGDYVLKEVSTLIRARIRESDIFARLGGDEFAIILPETPPDSAKLAIRKLVDAVAQHPLQFEGWTMRIGLSMGIAAFGPDYKGSRITARADAAAYHSKKCGRNRASIYLDDESCEVFYLSPMEQTPLDSSGTLGRADA
jgi:diguanylate cyclase (GGDEF)-like protein